jgi:two-component system, response regulator PdtaR
MASRNDAKTSRHVLVVDDDRLVLAALSEGLRAAGYRVTGAASGDDALGIALLDVRMPGMTGIELCRKLRERWATPFLFLSAYGDREIVQQATEEGALGYLVKPLDIQQIVPAIEAAIARASEIRELRQSGEQLTTALTGSREISMAVGLLMMRDRLNRDQAFNLLRGNARAQRRPIAEVAKDLLNSAESLYTIRKLESGSRRRKPAEK